MALHFPMMVNDRRIGYFYAQRLNEGTNPDSQGIYLIEIENHGEVWKAQITHRYGDGAFALVRKAITAWEGRHKVAKGFTTADLKPLRHGEPGFDPIDGKRI